MNTSFPRELQRQFEQAIASGEYARGETVTSGDLAGRFQGSAGEARQVLRAAVRKGLVKRASSGEDEFEVLGLPRSNLDSVFTHTAKSGLKPRSEVRAVEVEPATPLVAEKLGVEVGSPVYRYVRTRYAEGQPLANQVNYMPFEVCPGLEQDDVSRYSFQKLLEEKYFTIFTEAKEQFAIVPADQEDRVILGLPEGSPVLLVERIALSVTGQPVIWANIRIRPDRYEYVAQLWPEAAKLLNDERPLCVAKDG